MPNIYIRRDRELIIRADTQQRFIEPVKLTY